MHTLWQKAIQFWHPDYDPDRAEQCYGNRPIVPKQELETWHRESHMQADWYARKSGSGSPKIVPTVTDDSIEKVADLICSQEDNPGTSKNTRPFVNELNISRTSVQRIAERFCCAGTVGPT